MAAVTVPLRDITAITPRSRLLTIDLDGAEFPFLAGQALVAGTHGAPERRPYSIASSPEATAERHALELLVSIEADGTLGPNFGSLVPGTPIDLEGPLGTFTFPDPPPTDHLLFVAGGTGISPLRAMIDHARRRYPTHALSLLYSARRSDEFAFIDEFRDYERHGRLELHPTVTRDDGTTWEGRRGRIGRTHFESVLHAPAGTMCFVCGPPSMVEESVVTLRQLGVPQPLIRIEDWGR